MTGSGPNAEFQESCNMDFRFHRPQSPMERCVIIQGSLVNLLSDKCPWCEVDLSAGESGTRLAKNAPKWYRFTLSRQSTQYVQICPYCARPLKRELRKAWLLLVLPFAFCFVKTLFLHDLFELPEWLVLLSALLFVTGIVMAARAGSLKKLEE
jgi:hypothetical protein